MKKLTYQIFTLFYLFIFISCQNEDISSIEMEESTANLVLNYYSPKDFEKVIPTNHSIGEGSDIYYSDLLESEIIEYDLYTSKKRGDNRNYIQNYKLIALLDENPINTKFL
ncbi:hypothetical protein [Zunongwangia sp. HGR-M22]|uniref:hypothetical protein n=1 Tax=Zunongwangia sp. HGR-M22 TaxID=3015168 RepID=UPI0022DD9688|nr:hypothetical protein [Zunongwangia sp. HGR-M22]WBL27249.1 hypothetical protein PBT91_08220 [Zunongwangia sp. HGR-M22]